MKLLLNDCFVLRSAPQAVCPSKESTMSCDLALRSGKPRVLDSLPNRNQSTQDEHQLLSPDKHECDHLRCSYSCRLLHSKPVTALDLSPSEIPATHHTSPGRVPKAAFMAKRKRVLGHPVLPPPAYIYTRANDPNFNIFGGILLYPELCFALAANLRVEDLISLYAISRDFHLIINSRFATVIINQSLRKCPESARIFPFRCYKALCRHDPAPRIPHPHPYKQAAGETRLVPGFRWLKMVMFREKVCYEIVTLMAEDGLPVPRGCESALKKLWFLMELPDNARRIGYMHSRHNIRDIDLYLMVCFFVKLELRFNDPVAASRHYGLKKLLLMQRGLTSIWRTLKRSVLRDRYDILRLWIATRPSRVLDTQDESVFGIPSDQVGKLKMEHWGEEVHRESGQPCTMLVRPDQLVTREIIQRRMLFSKHFLRCLLWGYIDAETLENYPPRQWSRRKDSLTDEYYDEDECGGPRAFDDGSGDDLLDLGFKKPLSRIVQTWKAE